MTTGKNKEQFEKWYEKQTYPNTEVEDALLPLSPFNNLDIRLQIGVYLSFYDSLNYRIDVKSRWTENKKKEPMLIYELFKRGEIQSPWLTRNEAYREAFKQADLILNK
jgi:hypothetical protein